MPTEYFEQRERALLGPRYEQLYAAPQEAAERGVTVSALRAMPEQFAQKADFPLEVSPFCKAAFVVHAPEFKPGRHPYHHAGVFYSQEPSASSAAPLLGVQPGMRVLDLCAAPGGKSSQLAAALQGRGVLVSNEYVAARAEILKSNLERMGVPNAVVLNETPARIAEALPEFFDRVLVDAPCSGEGMFRKEPVARQQHCEALVKQCAELGAEILDCAAAVLAPGGQLVYSTCTFAPEEDEGQVAAFLQRHPEFTLADALGNVDYTFGSEGEANRTGGLPLDVGAVVCNVSTLTNIAAALDGKKVTEKYVTVGGAVKNPVTLRVPVGISLQELMDAAGGPTCDCKYIIGGPCMGRVVDTLDIPVTKTTGGLLAIPKDHPLLERKSPKLNLQLIMSVCCQCSMCTQMCPRNALGLNVQPHKAMRSLASGGDLLGEFNGIFSCCNCGLCTYYACNFGLKPSQVMQTLKSAIASKGVRPRKEVYGPVDGGLENKKVPVERLIARLGIAEYDVPAPRAEKPLTTSCVRIALRMGVGAPSVPVVAVGDKVRKNQLVADIAEKKLGVKMHASISGVVTDITADYIEIRKAAK